MADLNSVISGALAEARSDDSIPDVSELEAGDAEEVETGTEDVTEEADATAGEGDAATGDADADTDGDADAGTKEADKKVVEKTEAEKTAEKEAADKAAKDADDKEGELGEAKDAKGRENKIPHSRVVKITAHAVKKAFAPLAEALGMKPEELKPEAVVARLTQAREFEGKLKANEGIERLIDSSPDRFISMLATHHPGYKKFADVITGGAPVKPAKTAETPNDEPQPDMEIKNEKGEVTGRTYSLEGLKKRDAWRDAKLLNTVREEFKPLTDAQAAQQRAAELEPVLQAQIADAATWENWAELKPEVEKILVEDGKNYAKTGQYQHSLRSAYLQAANAKLRASAAEEKAKNEKIAKETRDKTLKEVKGRPKSTSVPGGGGKHEEPAGPRSLVDVIRGEVAKLKQ